MMRSVQRIRTPHVDQGCRIFADDIAWSICRAAPAKALVSVGAQGFSTCDRDVLAKSESFACAHQHFASDSGVVEYDIRPQPSAIMRAEDDDLVSSPTSRSCVLKVLVLLV
jgi:hypothetical protein